MCRVELDGIVYPSAEHAYVAHKTLDLEARHKVAKLSTPALAKKAGRIIPLRPDWDRIKDDIMRRIVFAKFEQNPLLYRKLLDTGDSILVEGNEHGDRYWGQCPVGDGKNMLGKILMEVRSSPFLL